MRTIFEGTDSFEKASPAIAHLNEVVAYLKRFEVHSKVFINPLSSLKEKFYKGSILFSCLYDTKRRDVFGAGGRYDSLIQEYRPKMGTQSEDRHAVGFSLAWEKLSISMARFQKQGSKAFLKKTEEDLGGIWSTKRVSIQYRIVNSKYRKPLTDCSSAMFLWQALMPLCFDRQVSKYYINYGPTTLVQNLHLMPARRKTCSPNTAMINITGLSL